MIVVVAMLSALNAISLVILIPFRTRVHGFSRRARLASEKKSLGFPGILANDRGKLEPRTQIGWQVCYYIALPCTRISTRGGIAPLCPPVATSLLFTVHEFSNCALFVPQLCC